MDWPYEDSPDEPKPPSSAPTWACPDDQCSCNEGEDEADEVELSLRLMDPIGERMPGAACRILYQGRVINEDTPNADGQGWITARLPRVPSTVLVEWAPAHKPRDPGYPYRCRYHVDLSEDRRMAARRRLHNLGFWRYSSLERNIKDFQQVYGYDVNGKLEDIEADLNLFHDEGRPPTHKPQLDNKPSAAVDDLPDLPAFDKLDKGKGDDEPARALNAKQLAPGAKGGPLPAQAKSAAPQQVGSLKPGVGTAKPGLHLPTLEEVITKQTGLFELISLKTEWTNPKDPTQTMWGHFWISREAMMWEVPNDATWSFWGGTPVSQPFPSTMWNGVGVGVRNDKRLVRLPCTGEDAQKSVKKLLLSQADLLKYKAIAEVPGAKPDSNDQKLPCMLPTTRLYNELYFQSVVKIKPQNLPLTYMKDLIAGALVYSELVSKELDTKKSAATLPTAAGLDWSLGTPGKIWAVGKHMDKWWFCKSFGTIDFLCINHGFHTGMQVVAGQRRASALQAPGGCHGWEHTDYSQIFIALAGWCYVKDIAGTVSWKPTAEVLSGKHGELWRLGRSTSKLTATEYVGNVKKTARPAQVTNPDASPDDEPHV
jgi:hypothetical protein